MKVSVCERRQNWVGKGGDAADTGYRLVQISDMAVCR
jgi:hypothetical protein